MNNSQKLSLEEFYRELSEFELDEDSDREPLPEREGIGLFEAARMWMEESLIRDLGLPEDALINRGGAAQ